MESRIEIREGQKQYVNGNHHPCRQTGTIWYRHDTVAVDGVPLEGFVQVKESRLVILGRDMKQNRIEVMTCFRAACVLGRDPSWLVRVNGEGTTCPRFENDSEKSEPSASPAFAPS